MLYKNKHGACLCGVRLAAFRTGKNSGQWLVARGEKSATRDTGYGARRRGFEMADSRFRMGEVNAPIRLLPVITELTPFGQHLILKRVAATERGTRYDD